MNYMNTHQSAHGDREFGFIGTVMRKERKVVAVTGNVLTYNSS
jgi:L-arabinose isomerase